MTYVHAPITEAIIDIRVLARAEFAVDELRAFTDAVKPDFPVVRNQNRIVAAFQLGSEPPSAAPSTTLMGFQCARPENDKIVTAQVDGWSFSKLAPYDTWEKFRDEARTLWEKYRSVAQPTGVSRLAVRYVNRLDLPLPMHAYEDYLRTFPTISSDLPQSIAGFFVQLQIPLEEYRANLVLNTAPTPPPNDAVHSVILDLDIVHADSLPQAEDEIWKAFENLRLAKNSVFEACITDATRELFK